MAKLFLTLAVLCVFGAVMVKGFGNDAMEAEIEACMEEVGADDANVLELTQDTTNYSMNAKCLLACIMKKNKLMDDNGKLVKDAALAYAEKNTEGNEAVLKIAEDIINICANIEVDDNACEAAIQYGKCFKEQVNARKNP